MKRYNTGSAILTVIITITLIMILAGTIMRSATLFHDFALQRVAHERHVRSLQALLNYAIAWCMVIDTYKTKDPQYQKIFNIWPPEKGSESGEVTIAHETATYTVTARLRQGTRELGTLSCRAHKNREWCVE